ncbi:hypothetical protein [Xanthomonas campestris]|nr:hypothetical protein [Xanthomonas campestris]MEA0762315.1 hypothetical protein [Xanthomonas campestris pv. campestris]MEB1224864.1 hypothetical protein [Xanthomonas campestris pv. campestris]MEB1245559.1 hypothetical protein [Xanthomonas campestris pv. campestris]MEB1253747.1 hypothetical protein [Xanthomonas campestris pv. campestris]MEB1295188.1 hypothetical protein [Xanthomonas campestris pv. campestris]
MDAVLASGECGMEEGRQLEAVNARYQLLLRFVRCVGGAAVDRCPPCE